jgi:hypothetical protein
MSHDLIFMMHADALSQPAVSTMIDNPLEWPEAFLCFASQIFFVLKKSRCMKNYFTSLVEERKKKAFG